MRDGSADSQEVRWDVGRSFRGSLTNVARPSGQRGLIRGGTDMLRHRSRNANKRRNIEKVLAGICNKGRNLHQNYGPVLALVTSSFDARFRLHQV
jgi:hypothetical protein